MYYNYIDIFASRAKMSISLQLIMTNYARDKIIFFSHGLQDK